jgi:hypothetical protein
LTISAGMFGFGNWSLVHNLGTTIGFNRSFGWVVEDYGGHKEGIYQIREGILRQEP